MRQISLYTLELLLLFCVMRLFLPLEFSFTITINSQKILPAIQSIFYKPLFSFDHITVNAAIIAFVIWFSGFFFLLWKQAFQYLSIRKLIKMCPSSNDERLLRILQTAEQRISSKQAKIIVHSSITTPAMIGWFHPIIILPEIQFLDDELLGIFIHELAHYRYKHQWIRFLTIIICSCFWWNPFIKDLFSETIHVLELQADKIVCENLTPKQQKRYLLTMIKILEYAQNFNQLSTYTCSLVKKTSSENLQQRFHWILTKENKDMRKPAFTTSLFVLFVFLLSYAFLPQPFSSPTNADFGNYDLVPDYRFYCIKSDNGYDLYKYPKHFIVHMEQMEEHMQWMQIYDNMEEIE